MSSLCDSFGANNDNPSPAPPLTSLRIELQSGVFDLLPIRLEDDPYELADDFIERHGIDRRIRDLLANNIKTAKEIAVSKEAKGSEKKEAFPSIFGGRRPFYEEDGEILGKKQGSSEKLSSLGSLGQETMEGGKDLKAPVDLLMKIKKILNPSLNKHAQQGTADKELTFTPTLNQRSREIARKSIDLSMPVYERLFQKQKERNSEEKSEEKIEKNGVFESAQKKSRNPMNQPLSERKRFAIDNPPLFGDRLYMNALCSMEKRRNNIERREFQRMREEEKELTFKPEINPVSQMIGRANASKNQRLEDYFTELHRLKTERIEQALMEKADEEIRECSFHPQINLLLIFPEFFDETLRLGAIISPWKGKRAIPRL